MSRGMRALQYQRHKDVWEHGLEFLDNYYRDPNLTSFYEFKGQDENAILKKHKEWFDTPSITEKGVKAMYLELINMLLDQDKEIYPSEVQAVTKLQGFQDLTNRLQRKINADLKVDLAMVKAEFADYRNQVETKHHVHESEIRLLKERPAGGANVEIRAGNNYDRPDGPSVNMIDMSSGQIQDLWAAIQKMQTEAAEESSRNRAEQDRARRTEDELRMRLTNLQDIVERQEDEIRNLNEKDANNSKKIKSLKGKFQDLERRFEGLESAEAFLKRTYEKIHALVIDNKNEIDRLKLRTDYGSDIEQIRRELRRLADNMKGLGRGGVEEQALWDLEERLKALIELQRNDFRNELEERLKKLRELILDELNRALARYQKNTVTVTAPAAEGPSPKDLEARIEMVAERLENVLEDLKAKVYDMEGKAGQVTFNIDQLNQDIVSLEANFNHAIDENLKSEQDSIRIHLQEFVINLIDENRRKRVSEVAVLRERLESYTSRPSTPTVVQPIVPKFDFSETRISETVLNLFTADNDQLRATILRIVRSDFESHKRELKADVSEGLYELDKTVKERIEESRDLAKQLEARLRKIADLEARLGGIEARVSEGRRVQDSFGAVVSTTQGDLDAIRKMVGGLGDAFMAQIKAWHAAEMQGMRMEMNGQFGKVWGALNGFWSQFKSSTLVFSADKRGYDHQQQCMGVYRTIGQYNGAPIYQQDRGDYFIYLLKGKDSRTPDYWYVGENIGMTHAWFRARADSARVPASLASKWEYLPLSSRVAGNRDMVWASDDSTIRLDTLSGLTSFNGLQVEWEN